MEDLTKVAARILPAAQAADAEKPNGKETLENREKSSIGELSIDNGASDALPDDLEALRAMVAADRRLRILSRIIQESREIMSYKPLTVREVLSRAIAWKTPTAPIPENLLFACYEVFTQNPAPEAKKRELNANDLLDGWTMYQNGIRPAGERQAAAALKGQLLLADKAAAACERCFGKGTEIVFDAGDGRTSAKPCDHAPITDEERRATEQAKADFFRRVRELARRPAPVSPRPAPKPVPDKGSLFACSVCKRIVSSVVGWREYDVCGAKIGEKTKGDAVLCDGTMNVYRAESQEGKG